jgi:predicted lipoprotein with Yx(FWY)xxD motif
MRDRALLLGTILSGTVLFGTVVPVAGCSSGTSDTGGSGGGGAASPAGSVSAGASTSAGASASPGVSKSPGAAMSAAPAVVTTASTRYGMILVDGAGRTLYLFEKDRPNQSECSGACAEDWPVFHGGTTAKAATGANAAMLGTIKRADHTTQVTYNQHPLYYYSDDAGRPGEIRGQNVNAFGARWYVVSPTGNKITGG